MVLQPMINKRMVWIGMVGVALLLAGCSLFGGGSGQLAAEEDGLATTTPPPTWTPVTLAPTLSSGTLPPTVPSTPMGGEITPTPGGGLGPTPLPPPTEIPLATATPEGGAQEGQTPLPPPSSGPGITMSPQMGEPGDTVVVNGTGFAPSDKITLYWADTPQGGLGSPYYELTADPNGSFEIGLIVLPANRWPGGAPKEGDDIWLVAQSEALGNAYRYYVQYLYVKRINPVTSLVLLYANTDFGYEIRVPNLWTWSWVEDDTSDVRFQSPGGVGKGFVLVINGTDVGAAISTVMSREFPGQTYSTAGGAAGTVPATRVTTSNGNVALFAPANGRVYVISFVDDTGKASDNIMSSFKLK